MARFQTVVDLANGSTAQVPYTPEEEAARDAEEAEAAAAAAVRQAAESERTAATTDLRDQYASAITALDAIIARNGIFTLAQAGNALDTLARIQRRTLRLLKAQVG